MHVADDGAARIGQEQPPPVPGDDGEASEAVPTSSSRTIRRPARSPRPAKFERPHRLYWWKELLLCVLFYLVYSWIRNQFGSNRIAAEGIPTAAFRNAERVIGFQQTVGLYFEPTIQQWWLNNLPGIELWNIFYGSAHFIVTIAVFAVLFWKRPSVFPQWRNTLAAMTALAIIGFAFFPLMPPRLLDQPCPWEGEHQFGGRCIQSSLRDDGAAGEDPTFGYVDTMAEYGTLWSFDNEAFASISNQYAAMPSLHIGWSTWCAIAMFPLLRRRRWKVAMLVYPAITLFTIVVTGNHWWLDGVGGLLVFSVGAVIGWGMHRWNQDRLDRRFLATQGV